MLEHWHPQLIREEAAFVLSMDREEALSTRVAKILAWVNMLGFESFSCGRQDCSEDSDDV